MNRRITLKNAVAALVATTIAAYSIASFAQSASGFAGTGTGAGNSTKPHRLVIQVSDADPAKWNLALNNAKNVQEELGAANVAIELVAYGPGIGMLKLESAVANKITDALNSGVQVVACENSLRNQKLTRADMLTHIAYVPAGVTEIMRRQGEGWAYIRP